MEASKKASPETLDIDTTCWQNPILVLSLMKHSNNNIQILCDSSNNANKQNENKLENRKRKAAEIIQYQWQHYTVLPHNQQAGRQTQHAMAVDWGAGTTRQVKRRIVWK